MDQNLIKSVPPHDSEIAFYWLSKALSEVHRPKSQDFFILYVYLGPQRKQITHQESEQDFLEAAPQVVVSRAEEMNFNLFFLYLTDLL